MTAALSMRRALPTKVFKLPAVQAVIDYKWDTWANRLLAWELVAYLVWLLGYQVFIFLFQVSVAPNSIIPGAPASEIICA